MQKSHNQEALGEDHKTCVQLSTYYYMGLRRTDRNCAHSTGGLPKVRCRESCCCRTARPLNGVVEWYCELRSITVFSPLRLKLLSIYGICWTRITSTWPLKMTSHQRALTKTSKFPGLMKARPKGFFARRKIRCCERAIIRPVNYLYFWQGREGDERNIFFCRSRYWGHI